jgi:DNA-binding response OmpR family regulator
VIAARHGTRIARHYLAFSLLPAHAPDLVVLDLGLPDADGKTLLAELRSQSSCR